MTRVMFDSVTPGHCPPGADLYLGYIDGRYPSYDGLVRLYPQAIHVPCTVYARDNDGLVLDVEAGDATPAQSAVWVPMRRAAGVHPAVYCSFDTWPAVRQAFGRARLAEPEYVIAGYMNPPDRTIPDGAVAHQWIDHGPYDESTVADHWPGVDPAPPPALPPPFATPQEFDMAMTAAVPGLPADHAGRVQHWETDTSGNLKCWNGAPQLKSLGQIVAQHPPIKGMVALPDGTGVVLIADDGHLEAGEWAESTFKITVGM